MQRSSRENWYIEYKNEYRLNINHKKEKKYLCMSFRAVLPFQMALATLHSDALQHNELLYKVNQPRNKLYVFDYRN